MSAITVILVILLYFGALIAVSFLTGKDDSNAAFFVGKKQSPWYVVAFGMIGASLSGVTFISVPGWVATSQFSYMQMVLGYLAGYLVIGTVLMPLYYRLNLTSIYGYLEQRFGVASYKTGSLFFMLSRVIGASFRLYLVAISLHTAVFVGWDLPFWVSVLLAIVLIWVYTFRSGIKTIIWTDTLQTAAMLLAVIITIFGIQQAMDWDIGGMISAIADSEYSQMVFTEDWNDKRHFIKQFLAGMFITIAMTGLDQDMMQKNLSCPTIGEAQKNMFWFSVVLVVANLLFLSLGALLYLYSDHVGFAIPEKGDELYPGLAIGGYLGPVAGVLFVIGLVAAAYSSADSALTALTTAFCVDFLGMDKQPKASDRWVRKWIHVGFSALLFVVILVFHAVNNDSVIAELFTVATYTYGPLLGLYAFGLFTKWKAPDILVPIICVLSPVLAFIIQHNSALWFNGYQFSFELLPVNGAITFLGLTLAAWGNKMLSQA